MEEEEEKREGKQVQEISLKTEFIGDSENRKFSGSPKTEFIGDLHIHSRFSRACSKNITIPELVKWAKVKGLDLLGTSDFTHPEWLKEIKELLVEKDGLYWYDYFPFMLTGEVSLMYTHGRGRRVHILLLVPSIDVVDKINSYLDTKGRRDYDGRPIFKIPCEEFAREMRKISDKIEVIPAHIWTPWFGVFGSSTGYDSLKEAFGEEFDNIHAIETGMSSDPEMNWRISELDGKSIVSFSDSHSFWPWRLGREATIFTGELSYNNILKQIRENSFKATIETDPAYGKYHWDGHRACEFSCSPQKSKELGNICPKCGKSLIIGVENRVEQLASHERGYFPERGKPFYKLLPLHELIALVKKSSLSSKKTWEVYDRLIEKFGNEFNILLRVDKQELAKFLKGEERLADVIIDNRIANITVKPGYDGVYGEPVLREKQGTLF